MNQTKVLIIGAGPAGLTLACELARRQVDFRIIEKSPAPPYGSRAKALQPRSLEIFNDLGITETIMSEGYTDLPYRKFNNNQPLGDTPRNSFPRTDTRYPKTLLLPQFAVEAALRARLETLGGTINWATEMTEFMQTEKSVECHLENPNWTEELSCKYIVACDGGKSTTRKKLGISFNGETHQEIQLWVGDVEVDGLKPDAWYNWQSPELMLSFALFPFKNSNTWQLQAAAPRDQEGNILTPTLEGFNKLFKERTQIEGVTFTSSSWQSVYRVNIRRADRFRVGNAFISGDAAHVHSIAGGMGMNTGIQDAYNLGWKLAAVINEEAKESLLDTYEEERIPIANWLLKTTSDRQAALLTAFKTGTGGMEQLSTADTTQLNLHYRESSLSKQDLISENGLQSGDRAPNVQTTDGRWLSDLLRSPEWKLLSIGDRAPMSKLLHVVSVNDSAVINAFGLTEGFVLIRPDGYIATITQKFEDIDIYLKSHLRK
jgi:2-polyprenyl-6-methoxyphenol hydroxylase-like FAD-dependent oxidoreductase